MHRVGAGRRMGEGCLMEGLMPFLRQPVFRMRPAKHPQDRMRNFKHVPGRTGSRRGNEEQDEKES